MTEQDYLRAAFDGDLPLLRRYVDQGGDVNVVNKSGMSALILAIFNRRDAAVVEYLIDAGVDLAIRQSSSGWRALTHAIVNGPTEHLELLIARGDRPARDGSDWKAVTYAVQYRNIAHAEVAILNGVDVDGRDDVNATPLLRAARNSDPVAVEMLLRHGADARAADDDGNTPLHFAAAKANIDNVRMLIEHGADPCARNAAGESAIDIARTKKKTKVLAMLEERLAS